MAEARSRIRAEITESLDAEGISPETGRRPSTTPRDLSLAELEQFQSAVEIMQGYTDRVGGGGGGSTRTTLPRGLSQEDVQAILDGRLPPNAVIVQAE